MRTLGSARLLSVALLSLVGCGLLPSVSSLRVDQRWARVDFDGLSYSSTYSLVATTLDGEGWLMRERDIEAGTLATDWRYGPSSREFRGPSRSRVHAEIEPYPGGCSVGLRVELEILVKGGVLAFEPRKAKGWERSPDDFDAAELLLARIKALVRWNPKESSGEGSAGSGRP